MEFPLRNILTIILLGYTHTYSAPVGSREIQLRKLVVMIRLG